MERQAQSSIAANVDLTIPDSDPIETTHLWSIIKMPQDSETVPGDPTTEPEKKTRRKTTIADPTTADPTTADPTTAISTTTKSAKIDDVDFEFTVLAPRGVKILGNPHLLEYELPFEHFETKGVPPSGKAAFYQALHHDTKMEVFLDGGLEFAERVAIEYRTADSWQLNERRFGNLAIQYFLRQEVMDMDRKKTGRFLAERRGEESIQPNPDTSWEAFPVLAEDSNTKRYDFALFPDAHYWLSVQAFSSNWTSVAHNYAHISGRRSTSPYLTVEYKRDTRNSGLREAVNQMTCAAILGQYNRWRLRSRVMKIRENISWTEEDGKAIRQYGLILAGAQAEVWVAEAQVTKTGEWMGSRVRRLWDGELKGIDDIDHLVNWINEIHHWGLGVHAEEVRKDVQMLGQNSRRKVPEF
ncbi:hypothetical protein SLS58_000617 [Diplodia intermedia]|uniref:Uncharacterized protein n=1 Tax=Diplodia intermedia TaxID=856260 RepID=A0ABR3U4W2_9PEZI